MTSEEYPCLLLEAINPVAIEDVARVLRSEIEEPRDEKEEETPLLKAPVLPSEQWFASVEIKIRPSSTSTVGAEEYRRKRSFGFDPDASVSLYTFASTPKN